MPVWPDRVPGGVTSMSGETSVDTGPGTVGDPVVTMSVTLELGGGGVSCSPDCENDESKGTTSVSATSTVDKSST